MKNGYVDQAHSARLLETWPDIDRSVSVEHLASFFHPNMQKGVDSEVKVDESVQDPLDPLAVFPPELVDVAEQPIVRGILGGGIVGNIASVVAARQLIFKVLTNNTSIPDGWEECIDASTASVNVDNLPCCFCPSCHSRI